MDLSQLDPLKETPQTLLFKLAEMVGNNPSVLDLRKGNKWIDTHLSDYFSHMPSLKLAVLTEQTLDELRHPLVFFSRLAGLNVDLHFCTPYHPEVLLISPESELANFSPDVVLAIFDVEKRCFSNHSSPDDNLFMEWTQHFEQTIRHLEEFSQRANAKILLSNFVAIWPPLCSELELYSEFGRLSFLQRANSILFEKATKAGIEVLPFESNLARWGSENCIDIKNYCNTDTVFTPEGFNRIAAQITYHLAAHLTPSKKALVVDADGSLWGGKLIAGNTASLIYRPDTYLGRLYYQAAQMMKEIAALGIQLILVGNHSQDAVMSVIERKDFPLNPKDFSAIRLNGFSMVENLQTLSKDLALELGYFAFVSADENHCALIRQNCPQVDVVSVPKNLWDYPKILSGIHFQRT